MKIKNILAALCFLCIGVSCSMEDDILNDVDSSTLDTKSEAYDYAFFDISLSTYGNSLQTKTDLKELEPEDPTGSESVVNNCFIAIVDEDGGVIANYFADNWPAGATQSTGDIVGKKLTKHVTIKVPKGESPNLKFVAFAQIGTYTTDVDRLRACTTMNKLEEEILMTHPNTYVKTGEITVEQLKADALKKGEDWTLKLSSQNLTHTDESCNVVTIPVSQRAARIQLDEFHVADVDDANVVVTGLQILNTCRYTYMYSEYTGDDRFEETFIYVPGGIIPGTGVDGVPESRYGTYEEARFRVYENTDESNPTSLKISYTVNGIPAERTYAIKTPVNSEYKKYVLAGHVYKLYVTVSHSSSDINYVISDWKGNTLTLEEPIYGQPITK